MNFTYLCVVLQENRACKSGDKLLHASISEFYYIFVVLENTVADQHWEKCSWCPAARNFLQQIRSLKCKKNLNFLKSRLER